MARNPAQRAVAVSHRVMWRSSVVYESAQSQTRSVVFPSLVLEELSLFRSVCYGMTRLPSLDRAECVDGGRERCDCGEPGDGSR